MITDQIQACALSLLSFKQDDLFAMAAFPNGIPNFDYFASIRDGAKELMAAEKAGHVPPDVDFGVQAVCASCKEYIMPPKKALRCTACKSVLYCSKEVGLPSLHFFSFLSASII